MFGGKALGWMAGTLIWMPGAPGRAGCAPSKHTLSMGTRIWHATQGGLFFEAEVPRESLTIAPQHRLQGPSWIP